MKNLDNNKVCEFQVILNKPELKTGLEVTFEGIKGKIIKMEGFGNSEPFKKEDYLVIELDHPNQYGCKIVEVTKESFYYLTYPENTIIRSLLWDMKKHED